MNTYYKYCPNVFLAKCSEPHEKGSVITLTTQYGKEHNCIVFNLIQEKDNYYFYSIVREDGFNQQEWALNKAEKYDNKIKNAEDLSNKYYEKSNKDHDFLSLCEPIKVGHYSEKRHRKIIEQAQNNMTKSVQALETISDFEHKKNYWESKAEIINVSMPESIEFYKIELEKAIEYHSGLKSGKYPKQHDYSVVYAKNKVNELQKNLKLAIKLWS